MVRDWKYESTRPKPSPTDINNNNNYRNKQHHKGDTTLAYLTTQYSMPVLPLLAGPAAWAAAKVVAIEVAQGLSAASLAALLLKLALRKHVPLWVREDLAFRKVESKEVENRFELDRLSHVLEKLQAMAQAASLKLRRQQHNFDEADEHECDDSTSPLSIPNLYATILCALQLSAQWKRSEPEVRNERYRIAGINRPLTNTKSDCLPPNTKAESHTDTSDECNPQLTKSELLKLQQAFQYALWSYYIHDQEFLLQQLLAEQDRFTPKDSKTTTATCCDKEEKENNHIENPTERTESLADQIQLLRVSIPTRPGHVGYYVADDPRSKTLILAVKGTTSLEELFTDTCGRSVSYSTEHPLAVVTKSTGTIDISENIGDMGHRRRSSLILPTDETTASHCPQIEVRAQIQDKVLIVEPDYRVDDQTTDLEDMTTSIEIVSGHERISIVNDVEDDHSHNFSLPMDGIDDDAHYHSVRCHEGIYIAAKRMFHNVIDVVEHYILGDSSYRLLLTGHSLGGSTLTVLAMLLRSKYPLELLDNDRLHVYAFGPPPALDHDSAIGCSKFVTSVVVNSDLISRCSLANLCIFYEYLKVVSIRMQECELVPLNSIGRLAAFWKQLAKGDAISETNDNSEQKSCMLMTVEEMQTAMASAMAKVELRHPEHLYIPGRVLLFYRDWTKDDDTSTSTCTEPPECKCVETDGTADILRFVELDGSFTMLSDHTTFSYGNCLEACLQQCKLAG